MTITLDAIDLGRLSADARETLNEIAPRMADSNDAKLVAEQLGLTSKQVNDAMAELREEMQAQAEGAVLPPLRDEDYEALKESIAQLGQLTPILRDVSGAIVDGDHRLRACAELGKEPWIVNVSSDGALREMGLAANTARRQLTPEQRRKIVTAELLYDPEASDRSVAAIAGVSPTTVGKVRVALQKRGLVSRVDTRRRVDGKLGAHPPIADDPGKLLAQQVDETELEVTFKIATDLMRAGWLSFDEWSEPFQLRLVALEDGGTDLWARKL